MTSDLDIYRTANVLIREHGDEADPPTWHTWLGLWLGQLPILSRLTFVVPLEEIRDALDQVLCRVHPRHSVFECLADVLHVIHGILPISIDERLYPELFLSACEH
jgi:hypothetical protein